MSGDDDPMQIPHGLRVLVADDDPLSRELALRMLARMGCAAQAADDGAAALDAHFAAPFDLILIDCEMPRLNGYDAVARLRRVERTRRTPVLALSMHDGPEQEQLCREAGMDGSLAKPLRLGALRSALAQVLRGAYLAPGPQMQRDELDRVCAIFGDDFAELAALYRKDGQPRIDALRRAQADADLATIARVAHALAGSSMSIGATGLSALCAELAQAAKAGRRDDYGARIDAIQAEYLRVCSRLTSLQRA